eukprot:Gb_26262 [translate_table: standard]
MENRPVSSGSSMYPYYDVFINHRGKDVKKTLASILYYHLDVLNLRVFLDKEELQMGETLSHKIRDAIRSASVHIAIFSKNYAESQWCLDELCLMLESGAKIIPVFYDVKPNDLRWVDAGAYADCLKVHEKKKRSVPQTLQKWKNALHEVSHRSGVEFDSQIGWLLHGATCNKLKGGSGLCGQQFAIKCKLLVHKSTPPASFPLRDPSLPEQGECHSVAFVRPTLANLASGWDAYFFPATGHLALIFIHAVDGRSKTRITTTNTRRMTQQMQKQANADAILSNRYQLEEHIAFLRKWVFTLGKASCVGDLSSALQTDADFMRTIQIVELKDLMDCDGWVKSVDVNKKQQKVTVKAYVERNKVLKKVKGTGKKAEIWPYVPYNLVYHPYDAQSYDKKASTGYVRNVEDNTMSTPRRMHEKYTTLFSDRQPKCLQQNNTQHFSVKTTQIPAALCNM